MTRVVIEPDASFETALKRFRTSGQTATLRREFTKRRHHERPSERGKPPALAARTKAKRRERPTE